MRGFGFIVLRCSNHLHLNCLSRADSLASAFVTKGSSYNCKGRERAHSSLSTRCPQENVVETLSEQVRKSMRLLPHHLTVVTAYSPQGAPTGLLVSSFNTVSLRPEPFVSFNIKLPSSTHDAIVSSGRFALTPIWSVETARRYSKQEDSSIVCSSGNGQASQEVVAGGIFKLECQWLEAKSVQVGDHVIMVGRVLRHIRGSGSKFFGLPLVYINGSYKTIMETKDP